ncbi:tpr repeat-containing protein [Leptolyngbya sp. Heron Island J]|uniref:tetratricopeptide repeat protein n=1 Tax=Leptolyngbya sp. Heron Island J TaxID=1385935 RepID=UPI0003B9EC17|nr:tetratricopeptide repeat protein [Leptolyngbya sp. Heron Island J]ESA33891.1 tpr repeat-containing protein [Leptolyngbya sp. Heron Island J]
MAMRFLAKIGLILLLIFGSFYMAAPEVQAQSMDLPEADSLIDKGLDTKSLDQKSIRQQCLSTVGTNGLHICKSVLIEDRDDSEVWNRLGRLFFDLEKYNEAYLSFMYATHLRADYAIAWANMCAALSQLQSYEKALNACDASLKVSLLAQGSIDEKVLALNNKAIALYLLGRYREALETSEQALVLRPDDSQANINREFMLHALTHKTTKSEEKSFI